MDTAAIEKHGLEPLQPELDAIAGIQSRKDLARVLGSRLRQDEDPINDTDFHTDHLFGLFVAQGLTDPSHNIAYLLQGGLTMPSRDYYLSDDKAMAGYRDKYKAYVAALLKQAGTPHAEAEAERVFALETKIAKAQESLVDSQDVHKANNLWSHGRLRQEGAGPGLGHLLQGRRPVRPEGHRRVAAQGLRRAVEAGRQRSRWPTGARCCASTRWMTHAPLLPKAYADLAFDFHGKTLTGVPAAAAARQARRRRHQRRAGRRGRQDLRQAVLPALGQAAGRGPGAQPGRRVRLAPGPPGLDDPGHPRQGARTKLDTLKVFVGYPDKGHWRSYADLKVSADNPLANAMAVSKFNYDFALSKLGKPVDRADWWMTPQTVNALNIPLENALNFPAAILQPPFFDPKADPAHNYGAIGAVIGHEISHSFDNMGSQFDAQGRMHNWWTPADKKHFEASHPQAGRAVQPVRGPAGPARERPADAGREHRRRVRPDRRLHRLPQVAERQAGAGDRRPDRRPALLPVLRPGLAQQDARGGPAPAREHRRARAAAVPRRDGAQPGCLVHRRSTCSRARSCTSSRTSACRSGKSRTHWVTPTGGPATGRPFFYGRGMGRGGIGHRAASGAPARGCAGREGDVRLGARSDRLRIVAGLAAAP